jgi:hypothetical protein
MERPFERIAVIGMGRSGTSFLAQFLAKSGVCFGERSAKYSKFEHPRAREINDAILEERFGAREGLPYGTLPEAEISVDGSWRDKAVDFIAYMDRIVVSEGDFRYWAFKDPRTTILHSLWLDDFDVLVAIFRHPVDVVASYLARSWVERPETALAYWDRFNRSLLTINARYAGDKPLYVVDHNGNVPRQLENLCARLGLPRNEAAFGLYRETERRESPLGALPPEVTQTYDELLALRNLS